MVPPNRAISEERTFLFAESVRAIRRRRLPRTIGNTGETAGSWFARRVRWRRTWIEADEALSKKELPDARRKSVVKEAKESRLFLAIDRGWSNQRQRDRTATRLASEARERHADLSPPIHLEEAADHERIF